MAEEALLALAAEFCEAGAPVQAVKCLEALVQPGHTSLLPLTEVHARLRLSQLLLEFTDNVAAAKIHLERAVRPPPLARRESCLTARSPANAPPLAALVRRPEVPCLLRARTLLRAGRVGEGAGGAPQRARACRLQPQAVVARAKARLARPPTALN